MTDRDERALEERLADQEWLTRDARECARTLFALMTDEQQRAIIDDAAWEWQWLLWSDLTPHPGFPPSWERRNRERLDEMRRQGPPPVVE